MRIACNTQDVGVWCIFTTLFYFPKKYLNVQFGLNFFDRNIHRTNAFVEVYILTPKSLPQVIEITSEPQLYM